MSAAQRAVKRPVEIEFRKLSTVDYDEFCDVARWADARDVDEDEHDTAVLAIDTLEGTMYANPGDYIIKGIKGEFYPCKPDIFLATYEVTS